MICRDAIGLDSRYTGAACEFMPPRQRAGCAIEQFLRLADVERVGQGDEVSVGNIPRFSADQHLMLTCPFARSRIVREARVVRGSDVPIPGLIQHECEVLGVIIAVDGGDIEYTAKPRLLERGRTQLNSSTA